MAYASLAEYKAARPAAGRDGSQDGSIGDALDVASADVTEWCQRDFTVASGVSARTFERRHTGVILVDDFPTTVGLVVVDDGTTLTINDDFYVDRATISGHPFYRLRFSPSRWSCNSWEPLVSVTANWGWAAVPEQVKRATIMLAADLLAGAANTFGYVGIDVGAPTRVRQNLIVQGMLQSFRRGDRTGL